MLSLGAIRGAFDSIQEFGFAAIWSIKIYKELGTTQFEVRGEGGQFGRKLRSEILKSGCDWK